MGTKGATGLKEIIVGSNTVDVINRVKCPVLVIPEKTMEVQFNNLVFASNYTEKDVEDINFLVEIAKTYNSEITVVHVGEEDFLGDYADTLIIKKLKKDVKSSITYERLKFKQLKGDVIEELNKYIEENNFSLLAMVTTQREFLGKIFNRSFTQKMAFHLKIPLLVLH